MNQTSSERGAILATAQAYASRLPNAHTLAENHIRSGGDLASFKQVLLSHLGSGGPARIAPDPIDRRFFGEGDDSRYSVIRALRILAGFEEDGFERDVSQQIAKHLGRDTSGLFMPLTLRAHSWNRAALAPLLGSRALVTTSGQDGSELVSNDMGQLVELLRARMMVKALGARVLSGLVGNVLLPRQAAAGSLSWTQENPGSDLGDSDATLDQVTMQPKSCMSTTAYTRQLLSQSSLDVEAFVREDLTAVNALGIDLASIAGTGQNNQPLGVLNVTGIGAVIGGINGAAPSWDHMVDLEAEVSIDNADTGALGYLTNAKVRAKLKKTPKISGDGAAGFIWEPDSRERPGMGRVNGYQAAASNHVPSNLTKGTASGVCSAVLFGNWQELIIGEWGVLELIVDPYSKKKQAMIEVTSFAMVDVAVRHPQSFAAMKDALTA